VNIFSADHHISVIADLKTIWTGLGHTVDDICLSGHHHVMGRPRDQLRLRFNMGDIVKHKIWEPFYQEYKDELSKYDAFVCCYPPCYAMLYAKWGKPIILQIPIRYDHPMQHDQESKDYFDNWLREHIDSDQVIPVANSRYDQQYFQSRVKRPCAYIPSLCEYTGMQYKPMGGGWIYYYKGVLNRLCGHILKKEHVLTSGYPWSDILKYRGIVHFPYQVSTMSIFEQYTANIPLLFPTKRLLKEMYDKHYAVLHEVGEVNWDRVYNGADYYNDEWMPHIQYFDSVAHLNEMVLPGGVNVEDVSAAMKDKNVERSRKVYELWETVLKTL